MSSFTVSVAGQMYHLAADADVAQLRERLVDAVRHGGDVVAIPCVGATEVSVLVSPGLPVFFEERPDAIGPGGAAPVAVTEDSALNMVTAQEWDTY
jgi:hypothetical protein